MPTGYTAELYDGKDLTLAEFATICARGMGAFIHQRDDGKVPLRRPKLDNPYYSKTLDEYRQKLANWNALSEEEKRVMYEEYFEETTTFNLSEAIRKTQIRSRYEKMLAEINSTVYPEKLSGFADFMKSQLKESIDFDCTIHGITVMPYEEWVKHTEDSLHRMIDVYEREVVRERIRHEETNTYINDMIEYFGIEVE